MEGRGEYMPLLGDKCPERCFPNRRPINYRYITKDTLLSVVFTVLIQVALLSVQAAGQNYIKNHSGNYYLTAIILYWICDVAEAFSEFAWRRISRLLDTVSVFVADVELSEEEKESVRKSESLDAVVKTVQFKVIFPSSWIAIVLWSMGLGLWSVPVSVGLLGAIVLPHWMMGTLFRDVEDLKRKKARPILKRDSFAARMAAQNEYNAARQWLDRLGFLRKISAQLILYGGLLLMPQFGLIDGFTAVLAIKVAKDCISLDEALSKLGSTWIPAQRIYNVLKRTDEGFFRTLARTSQLMHEGGWDEETVGERLEDMV